MDLYKGRQGNILELGEGGPNFQGNNQMNVEAILNDVIHTK